MDTITSKNAAENCSARPHQEVAVNKEVQEQGGKRVARVAVVPHQDLDLGDREGRGHLSKREFSRNPQWPGQRMKPLRRVYYVVQGLEAGQAAQQQGILCSRLWDAERNH